jgi:hypothetical protein
MFFCRTVQRLAASERKTIRNVAMGPSSNEMNHHQIPLRSFDWASPALISYSVPQRTKRAASGFIRELPCMGTHGAAAGVNDSLLRRMAGQQCVGSVRDALLGGRLEPRRDPFPDKENRSEPVPRRRTAATIRKKLFGRIGIHQPFGDKRFSSG